MQAPRIGTYLGILLALASAGSMPALQALAADQAPVLHPSYADLFVVGNSWTFKGEFTESGPKATGSGSYSVKKKSLQKCTTTGLESVPSPQGTPGLRARWACTGESKDVLSLSGNWVADASGLRRPAWWPDNAHDLGVLIPADPKVASQVAGEGEDDDATGGVGWSITPGLQGVPGGGKAAGVGRTLSVSEDRGESTAEVVFAKGFGLIQVEALEAGNPSRRHVVQLTAFLPGQAGAQNPNGPDTATLEVAGSSGLEREMHAEILKVLLRKTSAVQRCMDLAFQVLPFSSPLAFRVQLALGVDGTVTSAVVDGRDDWASCARTKFLAVRGLPLLVSVADFELRYLYRHSSAAREASAEPTARTTGTAIDAAMRNPKLANEIAPDEFRVRVETTKGTFTIAVHKKWSPIGADRFYNLVRIGYYRDIALFRAIAGFVAQAGIHGDPSANAVWQNASINDDPPTGQSNRAYTVAFAKKGIPNSRSVQFFINLKDNEMLDQVGFVPFGEVIEGEKSVDKINTEYGEAAPRGHGPDQIRAHSAGNAYFRNEFPNLDYIKSVSIL